MFESLKNFLTKKPGQETPAPGFSDTQKPIQTIQPINIEQPKQFSKLAQHLQWGKFPWTTMQEGTPVKTVPEAILNKYWPKDLWDVIPAFKPNAEWKTVWDIAIEWIETSALQAGKSMENILYRAWWMMSNAPEKYETKLADDVTNLLMGTVWAWFQIIAPARTLGFAWAGENPITKNLTTKLFEWLYWVWQEMADSWIGRAMTKIGISDETKWEFFNLLSTTFAFILAHQWGKSLQEQMPSLSKDIVLKESMTYWYTENIKALFWEDYQWPMPSKSQINRQATKLLSETHPDKPGWDIKKFQEINRAKTELLNTEKNIKEIDERIAKEIENAKPGSPIKDMVDTVKEFWKLSKETGKEIIQNTKDITSWKKKLQWWIDLRMFWEDIPQTPDQYKQQAIKRLDQELVSEDRDRQLLKKEAQQTINETVEAGREIDGFDINDDARTVIQLSQKLGIDPEAVPQSWKVKQKIEQLIKNEKSYFKKEQIKKMVPELRQAQKRLEEWTKMADQDPETVLDQTATQMLKEKPEEKNKFITEQIEEFLLDDKQITNPKAEELLRKVLEWKSKTDVIYNWKNYTELVTKTIDYHLKQQRWETGGDDIMDVIARMEQPKQPTEKQKTTQKEIKAMDKSKTQEVKAPAKDQVELATSELLDMYKDFIKQGQEQGAKFAMGKVLKDAKKIREAKLKQPTVSDIAKLMNKYAPDILKQALDLAKKKQAITTQDHARIQEQIDRATRNPDSRLVNAEKDWQMLWLSEKQKIAMMHWNKFNDIFKDTKDHKVNFKAVSESLTKNNLRMHVVTPGSHSRLPIPFALMGNKASTAQNILAPLVEQWLFQWKNIYIEPFGGAGTSILLLPRYLKINPNLRVDINIFDAEKYTLIDRVRWKDESQIYRLVSKNYGKIMGDITAKLLEDNKFKEAMTDAILSYNSLMEMGLAEGTPLKIEDLDKLIGTKEMTELAELVGFYPNLAKQYFKERIDGKVSIKWELTDSFKEWLDDHIRKTGEKQGLDWEKLEEYVIEGTKKLLNEESKLFEKIYPKMSKAIWEVLDIYDVMKDNMTPDEAMLTSIARQLRQRGTSWQRMISAWEWFQNVEWVKTKLWYWLTEYQKVLNKYENTVKIHNKDGWQFIKDMAEKYKGRLNEMMKYDDPPYVQSAQVYKANAKDQETKDILDQFANPEKLADMYRPLKDVTTVMTNDINWPYITAMAKLYWQNFGKDVLWYKEWTTPTSLLSTADLENTPGKLKLGYYTIRRNPKYTTMEEAMKEEILPKIAKWLERPLVKMFQNYSLIDEAEALRLVRIKEKIEEGTIKKEQAEQLINSVMKWQEARSTINLFFSNLRQSKITGGDAVRLIKMLERHMNERADLVDEFNNLKKLAENKKTIDVDSQEYLTARLDQYTSKNPTWEAQELAKKYDDWDVETIADYFEDPKVQAMIDSVNKININSLSNDQIVDINKQIKYDLEQGIDEFKYKQKQEKELIESEIEKYKGKIFKEEFAKYRDEVEEFGSQEKRSMTDYWKKTLSKKTKQMQIVLDEIQTSTWMIEELGLTDMGMQYIDKYVNRYRDNAKMYEQQYAQKRYEIEKKYNKRFTKQDMENIGLHMLANKDNGRWIGPLIAILESQTINPSKEKIKQKIEMFKSEDYLTPAQKELKEVISDILDKTWDIIEKTYKKSANKLFVKEKNYFPVKKNRQLIEKIPDSMKNDSSMLETQDQFIPAHLRKGFTKQAKGSKIIPIYNAEVALIKHIKEWLYYAEMEIPLTRMKKILNWMKEELWDRWYKYMSEYIERMMSQGNLYKDVSYFEKQVEKFIWGYRKWILMSRVTTTVLQLTDIGRSVWVLGNNPIPEIWQILTSKTARETVRKYSWHIRHREVDDPTYAEENAILESMWKLGKKIDEVGMYSITMADRFWAMVLFLNRFKYYLAEEWLTQQTATEEQKKEIWLKADRDVMKVMSDPSFVGVSNAILKAKGFGKLLVQFQNFVSTQWSQARTISKKESLAKTLRYFTVLMIALSMEELIREWRRKVLGKESNRSRTFEKWKRNPATVALGIVPILENFMDLMTGDFGVMNSMKQIANKKNYSSDKVFRRVIINIWYVMGLPMAPLDDFASFIENRNKNSGVVKIKPVKVKPVKIKQVKIK